MTVWQYTMSATRTETAYLFGAPVFTFLFSGVSVA